MKQTKTSIWILILFLVQVTARVSFADTTAPGPRKALAPGMFEAVSDGVLARGAAGSCLALPSLADDLPCHPAFVPLSKDPQITASLIVSEGYEYIEQSRKIQEGGSSAFVGAKTLIDGPQPAKFEMLSKISFVSPYFNAQYLPSHLQLYSHIQGDINPTVQLYLLKTETLRLQWGVDLNPMLAIGIQSWIGKADLIHKTFALLDLGTDSGKDYLNTNKANFALIESGIVFKNPSGRFRLSLLARSASQSTPIEIADASKTQIDSGISYSVIDDIRTGRLTLMGDYRDQLARIGLKYDYGVLSITAGTNALANSYGLVFLIKKMYSGIVFSRARTSQTTFTSNDSVYTTFGIQL